MPNFTSAAMAVTASLQGSALSIATEDSDGLFVAISENGRESQVKAGENRGRLLKHDAVVRLWQPLTTSTKLTLPLDLNLANAKLVVWREIDGVAIGAAQIGLANCQ